MRIIKRVNQSEVFSHWEKVEKISIWSRQDIVFPLVAYGDLVWSLAVIEDADIEKIHICSSDDWKTDGLCTPDFKLTIDDSNTFLGLIFRTTASAWVMHMSYDPVINA